MDEDLSDCSASLFYFQIGSIEEDSLEFAHLRIIVKYFQAKFQNELINEYNIDDAQFVKVAFTNHRQ